MFVIKQIFDSILPEKCALCRKNTNAGFCIDCQTLLPWKHCFCAICGVEQTISGICGRCQNFRPDYFQSVIPFIYSSPISDQIQQLKYQGQIYYARPLARMLGKWSPENTTSLPDVLIPIPLHRNRIKQRGFNQALEITRTLSKQLNIPFNKSVLKRQNDTSSQTGLSERLRRMNVKGAFVIGQNVRYEHVTLVDDVVTSGSTVNEAARILIQAGVASKVSVWAIAKT
ncbi:MAG: hypothetical protein GKR95_09030 [Gammaproteobacteria bacterium]|nr:hypothetical protein [Gammaproteobacteria bacterium]